MHNLGMVESGTELSIRVQLVQQPLIWVTGQPKPISVRGLGRAILFLVFLRGASSSRAEMCRTLWPEEPEEVAANRLRVSLNRIKAILGQSLVTTRVSVRLVGISVSVDLWDKEILLQEALDEVDTDRQFELLKSHSDSIRSAVWRDVADLDTLGSVRSWDEVCRKALERMVETAFGNQDWNSIDFVWEQMCHRGELNSRICERFLHAQYSRGSIEEGLRLLRRAANEVNIDEDSEFFQSLRLYAQNLKSAGSSSHGFHSNHFQLLGSALLSQPERFSSTLADLLVTLEVQLHMQSLPTVYMQILETVLGNLEKKSPQWIELEATRLSAYASLCESDKVIEISESLLQCEVTPWRASTIWMYYAFSLFEIRRWDDALTAIHRAQEFAESHKTNDRMELCRLTEGSFLWHLGEVEKARNIYDSYLERFSYSKDFSLGINRVITHFNYAILELVFGDTLEARRHVDLAYAERKNFNLARVMPSLLALMGIVYGRSGEVYRGVDLAIEGLKLTYGRGSNRESQINLEWACGLLALGDLRAEAWNVMEWVNTWRTKTRHARSVCEVKYFESLELGRFERESTSAFESDDYRHVMRFVIKGLRKVQKSVKSDA